MKPRIILPLVCILALVFSITSPVKAQEEPVRVFYAGADGGVLQALNIDSQVVLVGDIASADVFMLNGIIPQAEEIRARVEGGAGLILVLGPEISPTTISSLLDENILVTPATTPLSLQPVEGIPNQLLDEVDWTGAPQVRERFMITATGFTPLVQGLEDQALVMGTRTLGSGQVYIFTAFLDDVNPQFQEWAYFNYFIHFLALSAAGRQPGSFSDYAGSPVPHRQAQVILLLTMLGILTCSFTAFVIIRRYSKAHPELLDQVVTDRNAYKTRVEKTDWEIIGFHRPLAGFFVAMFVGFILFIPYAIYQNMILPVYILPSAQALGIWGRVTQFFNLIWIFLDMGTSAAFIKFYSEHRVHNPSEGVKYGQIFVWWQALSGAVQVAFMVMLASVVMPQTAFAIYAWSVIIHTFIQLPGFYQIIKHALMGLQRLDFAQILELSISLILPMLMQPIFVIIMVAWGKGNPVFGASVGGLLGMGLAAYATELLAFIVSLFIFRRLGYNARVYFLAHFDWQTIKKAFRYGTFEMLGSAAWGVGQSAEILITQRYLLNYAEVWGNWVLAQNFVFAFNVIATLYNGLMPSISEAFSNGRRILSKYYAAAAYKWGGLMSAMLAALLLAVCDRFILGASGPEFTRAAVYVVPLLIWGAVQYPSWVGDNIQRGANKPWMIPVLVMFEQIIRIVLALLLVARMQINGLILAYFVGLLSKGIVSYFVTDRLCYKLAFYFWQSLGAPVLAGAAHYLVLRSLTGLIWQGDQVTSVIIFFIAILPSYPIFCFFYGLFGGWDDNTLAEVQRAAHLSSFMRPLAWLFWAASALGARISPLHNRFPIKIYGEAMEEARSLTGERVSLV